MGAGGLSIDIILFAMIALFLVLRLRSILGRRQGFERPAEGPSVAPRVMEAAAEPVTPPPRAVPEMGSPAGRVLAQMAEVDRGFTPARFLDGAEAAFRMIVTAFAAGDRVTLRPLLSEETYKAFEGAVAARETAGELQTTEVRAVGGTIDSAELAGTVATVHVRFVSDQVTNLKSAAGEILSGTDAVTEIVDLWTFERDLGQSDPSWRLVAARSA